MAEEIIQIIQNGVPVINYNLCTHCKTCIEICPQGAISNPISFSCSKCVKYCITMEVPCPPDHYVFNYKECNNCGDCIEHCPADALHWSKK